MNGIADHLWQSTAFTAVAALLVLMLRRNRAATRYWLWIAASLKFLVPFSVLISFGGRFTWRTAPAAASNFSYAIEQAGQPFAQMVPVLPRTHSLPVSTILIAVWALGLATVLLRWAGRWLKVRAAVRAAKPIDAGPEIEILRRIAGCMAVDLRLSQLSIEPGVFGIFRPVLLLPAGIASRLDDSQLEVIFAHELCHVRRRDNLSAALHMLVESIFWFHPLVWWLGARLVEERERACDEDVLRLGGAPQSYAESVLRVCEFCLESPLACVAGVTGADLKKRIERIMSHRAEHRLGRAKKLLLALAGFAAVAGPIAIGIINAQPGHAQQQSPLLAFEAASVKPSKPDNGNHLSRFLPGGKFTAENVSLKGLVMMAFHLQDYQLKGGPAWADSDGYDVNARPEKPATVAETRRMLQTLLADRFHLAYHYETKEMPIYALLATRSGPKLDAAHGDREGDGDFRAGGGHLIGQGATVQEFADMLTIIRGKPVFDMTAVPGKFDWKLEWTPDQFRRGEAGENTGAAQPHEGWPRIDPDGPDFFTALEQQTGLKLESRKGPVQILVIDHAERPTEVGGLLKRLWQSTAFLAVAAPAEQATGESAELPTFEVATVKPTDPTAATRTPIGWFTYPGGRLTITQLTLRQLVQLSYGVLHYQVTGGPGWTENDRFDITAKAPESSPATKFVPKSPKVTPPKEMLLMLRALLVDRFHLKLHTETKDVSAYALVAARSGPKLSQPKDPDEYSVVTFGRTDKEDRPWTMQGHNASMAQLAARLAERYRRPVVDETGIMGQFDFHFEFAAEDAPTDAGPSLFSAIEEQAGLKLASIKAPQQTLVIDHAEKPAGN